jgi:hypothetical protein
MRVDDGREFGLSRLELSIKLWSYSRRTSELIPQANLTNNILWRISRVDDDGLFCGLVRHEVGIVIALPRPCTIV